MAGTLLGELTTSPTFTENENGDREYVRSFRVEVDSKTGVIRLVVGSSSAPGPMLSSDASVPLALEAAPERVLESPELEEPQNGVEVIKVRRGGLPIEIYNTLVSDE